MRNAVLCVTLVAACLVTIERAVAQWKGSRGIKTAPEFNVRTRPNWFEVSPDFRGRPDIRAPQAAEPPLRDLHSFKAKIDPYVDRWNEAMAKSYAPGSATREPQPNWLPLHPYGQSRPAAGSFDWALEQKNQWWSEGQKARVRSVLEQQVRERLLGP